MIASLHFSIFYYTIVISAASVIHLSAQTQGRGVQDACSLTLVESIPENLTYPAGSPKHLSIYESWLWLTNTSKKNINIAAFYWTLNGSDIYNFTKSSREGETILKLLYSGAVANKFKLNLVTDVSARDSSDFQLLRTAKGATLQWLNMDRFFKRGIEHTKLWTVDGKHAFVGSANMDWRSLTQVKETGVLIRNCPQIVHNMDQIFQAYWYLSDPKNYSIPSKWPQEYVPHFNLSNPLSVMLDGVPSNISLSNSPKSFNPIGRDNDIDAIIFGIEEAEKFIYISVMDYSPLIVDYSYKHRDTFWPVIDDALRAAALNRKVTVRLLISKWEHTFKSQLNFLKSLQALMGIKDVNIEVKLFIVPAFTYEQQQIPFSRVNHSKFMITDKVAYIGTSNWTGDYFLYTAGVGFMVRSYSQTEIPTLQQQLEEAFLRDWNSNYAHPLSEVQ